ncbi:phosphotransferase family protein [Pseudonocardia alni]|uniref:phosphotransferase family protein n=1 Tax=Pseudonocardia alni TaxID=33907 RepID=UPI003331BC88
MDSGSVTGSDGGAAADLSTPVDGLCAAVVGHLRRSWADPRLHVEHWGRFGDGHSGDTFSATLYSTRFHGPVVARLSPPGVTIAGPADVGRQGRILGALHTAGAPAPRVLEAESGPVVDGRAIVVMERLSGEGWSTFRARRGDRATASAAVAALRVVQAIPADRNGIPDDRSFGLLEEVDRWTGLLRRCPDAVASAAQDLRTALAASAAVGEPDTASVLVHGDLHYGNMLFGDDRVVAVLDWEIAALGHPLTDVGCLAVASLRRHYSPDPNPTGDIDIALAELAELYDAAASAVAWHTAAACLKYTAIIGYNLHLHRSGRRPDPIYESLQTTMHRLLDDGARLLATGLADR